MLPLKLTIEGLYSYQEKQTIDFQSLCDAGLFGIFGAVGSGKSSILEAITFALYGETERLNSKDKRAYNMMNLKSNRSYIDFEFLNFEDKKYRIEREFRRNSKNFDDIRPGSIRFFQWQDNQWMPLEENIEHIVELSYDNFKRTIIIPQGQFKEFLELGAKDRTQMMKEIFNLDKYDLAENTKILTTETQSKLDQLEGQLKGFEQISPEKITEYDETLKKEKQELEILNEEFRGIHNHFQQLKNLKADWEKLIEKRENLSKLSEEEQKISHLEETTEEFARIQVDFSPLISDKYKLEQELFQKQTQKNNLAKILENNTLIFNEIESQLEELKPKYNNLSHAKNEENDIKNIIEIVKIREKSENLKQRLKNGNIIIEKVEKNITELRENIIQMDDKISELKSQKINNKELIELGNWYGKYKNLGKQKENQDDKINNLSRKHQEIKQNINISTNTKEYLVFFDNKFREIEEEKQQLFHKKTQLEVQQELSKFSDTLHQGKECPLCGSLEHPKIAYFEDFTEEIMLTQDRIKALDVEIKKLQAEKLEFEKNINTITHIEEQISIENKLLTEIISEISEHKNRFIWENFSPDHPQKYEEQKQLSFQIEKNIQDTENKKQLSENQIEIERINLKNYNKGLENIREEEAKCNGQILSLKNNLQTLIFEDFAEKNITELEQIYENLSQQNINIEKNYTQLTEKQYKINTELTEQKTNLHNLEYRISEVEKSISENTFALKENMYKHHIEDLEKVYSIINQEINIIENRKIIQDFRINFETLKNSILELELKFKNNIFDNDEFFSVENKCITKENERNEKQKQVNVINAELDRLKKLFQEKEELIKELNNIQKRADNLKIMTQLFKGAGFVQYVSSIYLRQLCDHANIRFHKMTKNSLSLHINENNEFEIIDYLNEGRKRSVKTLSGGQAFQVSLSLALALAESVQTNAKSHKNFFFIDEGFGTQDIDSVNIIFETLSSLMRENRIVGIISHIEELKEKIPMALSISKDTEKGSFIQVI